MAKYDIDVELIGQDGNAFGLISKVTTAIKRQVGAEEADLFMNEATQSGSYDELLVFIMDTVNVTGPEDEEDWED